MNFSFIGLFIELILLALSCAYMTTHRKISKKKPQLKGERVGAKRLIV